MRAIGYWIPVSEELPPLKKWCWVWVEGEYVKGECMKMFLTEENGWNIDVDQPVHPDSQKSILAWQPYVEPQPYVEMSEIKKANIRKATNIMIILTVAGVILLFGTIISGLLNQ